MMQSARPARTLWHTSDLVVLFALNVVGLTLIVLAWLEASGEAAFGPQIVWVDVAAIGVLVATGGNLSWVFSARRSLGTERRALTPRLEQTIRERRRDAISVVDDDLRVTARNMTRYHREGCLLVQDKDLRVAPVGRHRAAGRKPCDVCQPDDGRP